MVRWVVGSILYGEPIDPSFPRRKQRGGKKFKYSHVVNPLCFLQNRSLVLVYIAELIFSVKEGNVLFNDALNTFYLRLYGVRHMVKNHSDSERGNPPLFPISSKGSFIFIIPQTG